MIKKFGKETHRYENGQLHSISHPAISTEGYRAWYINGMLHRESNPAIEHANGDKEWYQDGKLHRLDGPAVERLFNSDDIPQELEWWINGERLTEEEFNRRTNKHTIVIDGKTIEISEESYQNMKNSLTS